MKNKVSRHFFAALLNTTLVISTVISTVAIATVQAPDTPVTSTVPITRQTIDTFFDTTLSKQMAEEQLVGATVAVVKDGKLLFRSLLGFADTFVFPAQTMTLITWLWTINIPAVLALLVFTGLAWRNHTWRPAWRIHYTLTAVAGVFFLGFLINWNLLPI